MAQRNTFTDVSCVNIERELAKGKGQWQHLIDLGGRVSYQKGPCSGISSNDASTVF